MRLIEFRKQELALVSNVNVNNMDHAQATALELLSLGDRETSVSALQMMQLHKADMISDREFCNGVNETLEMNRKENRL